MADEAEVIKQQMTDTRTALSDKLEKLEDKVVTTVQQTTDSVAETVQSVKDAVQGTVGAMQETVENTVDAVKEKVQDTVDTVKGAFDFRRQVEEHPWAMFGGSFAVGFLLGRVLPGPAAVARRVRHAGQGNGKQKARFNFPQAAAMASASEAPGATAGGGAGVAASSLLGTLGDALAPALDTLKSLAIGTTTGVLGEVVLNAVPEQMKDQVRRAIDEITTKLGGRKVFEPGQGGLFRSAGAPREPAPAHPRMGAGPPYRA